MGCDHEKSYIKFKSREEIQSSTILRIKDGQLVPTVDKFKITVAEPFMHCTDCGATRDLSPFEKSKITPTWKDKLGEPILDI